MSIDANVLLNLSTPPFDCDLKLVVLVLSIPKIAHIPLSE